MKATDQQNEVQFRMTYKVLGQPKITTTAYDVEELRDAFECHRDFDGFGSSELLTKVLIFRGNEKKPFGDISYNGTINIYPSKK